MTLERNDIPMPVLLTAPPDHREEALSLVFSMLPAEDLAPQVATTLSAATDPGKAFSDLLIARRGQRIVGATWVQAAPGRTAIVWAPQLRAGEPEATATVLFGEVETRLLAGDVDLAQAIQWSQEGATADRLKRHGFQFAARLLYLICDVGPSGELVSPGSAEPAGGGRQAPPLEFEPFEEFKTDRLLKLVERTYVDTQDIPILNDLRHVADVLDGYRHTGTYDPHNWFLVRSRGSDVGCLLLADHPDLDEVELIYMGVVPEARGLGFGKRLARHAKRHTLHTGRSRLILAVDAENDPALSGYASAGFLPCYERYVFLRSLRD